MKMNKPIFNIGDSESKQIVITEADVAKKTGEGSLTKLLGTPDLVEFMIQTSIGLIDSKLDDGFISVGKKTSVTHEHPSVVGETVTLKVEISGIEHNHIELEFKVWDELGVVAAGSHVRTIVNDEWLMIKIKKQRAALENKNF